ncbi:MAG TPA: hypothetical protein VFA26_24475 [Gemmataceae bacterium]|nr:hypothetical protein [Gemmataceae bacterium]
MGIGRRRALERLNELVPEVERHLGRIAAQPHHSSAGKWKGEVRGWLGQMQEVIRHVGKKTGAEWQARIDAYREALGE